MRSDLLDVKVGDVVALTQPGKKPSLARVIDGEGGARFSDANDHQVVREPDDSVMTICSSWITQRRPRGPGMGSQNRT